jgi:hypothetical protein
VTSNRIRNQTSLDLNALLTKPTSEVLLGK